MTAGTTVKRRQRTDFAADPARHQLAFTDGLTVKDFTRCPVKNMARRHWVDGDTCRCMTEPADA